MSVVLDGEDDILETLKSQPAKELKMDKKETQAKKNQSR